MRFYSIEAFVISLAPLACRASGVGFWGVGFMASGVNRNPKQVPCWGYIKNHPFTSLLAFITTILQQVPRKPRRFLPCWNLCSKPPTDPGTAESK